MAETDMIKGHSRFLDDFSGPFSSATSGLIASKCIYTTGDGATVTRLAINGGAARLTIAADEADVASVFGPRQYEPDEAGLVVMQVRVRINTAIASSSVFIGFTDSDADTRVAENEDGVLDIIATDLFGVLLEAEQDGTLGSIGAGNDVDDVFVAFTNMEADWANAEWHTIRIEADSGGNTARTLVRMRVYVDGKVMNQGTSDDALGWRSLTARSSIVYCPVVSADARAVAYTVDIAELYSDGGIGIVFD